MTLVKKNENSDVYVDDHGVFTIEWNPDTTLEIDDFKSVVDIYDEWSKGEHWAVLHIFPKGTNATSEARSYAAKREKRAGAEAFVIESRIHRNLFRLYRRLRSVKYPMREFNKKDAAVDWLLNVDMKLAEPEN